jgi:hypothetical protein
MDNDLPDQPHRDGLDPGHEEENPKQEERSVRDGLAPQSLNEENAEDDRTTPGQAGSHEAKKTQRFARESHQEKKAQKIDQTSNVGAR